MNKVRIQRIGIPTEKITFRPRKPKAAGEKTVFIFTGRFTEKKGLLPALEAMKQARQTNDQFEFRIVGDGVMKTEIENYIQQNDMDGYVQLLGFLTYEEYIKETQQADIFLHPSVTASDGNSEGGAPTTILEAQAAGMPVVSTYHADIPHVVVPGESALLSEEGDREGLVANILRILDDQDQWEAMGQAGRKFVEDNHDVHVTAACLESLYDSIRGRS